MAELYYATEEFASPEFTSRKVIDEIKMSMSAFDCMLPDDAGIYCSSDITTGKRFYYEVLKTHGVRSEDELKEKLGPDDFNQAQQDLIQFNVPRAVTVSQKLLNLDS